MFAQRRISFGLIFVTALLILVGCAKSNATPQRSSPISARMLVAPNALVGPTASNFTWSPQGASLLYIEPQDGQDLLWLYQADSGQKRMLLDPSQKPGNIQIDSAQWSPQGDSLLFTGEDALWLMDIQSGELKSLAKGNPKTAVLFSPSGDQIAYAEGNNLYAVNVVEAGKIRQLSQDGSDTIFNGTLDWVYNEELATRAAQPAFAWAPDGKRLFYLRLDDSQIQNHSVTDYRPVPPTISYTRYPTSGSANPQVSLWVVATQADEPAQQIPLDEQVEYILPFFTWTPDGQEAVFITLNREHTRLDLQAWNPTTQVERILLTETSTDFISEDFLAAPVFLSDGKRFLWLSERDDFMHLYLYSSSGELIQQLTQGDWLIDTVAWDVLMPGKPVQVDPSGKWAYFSTTKTSPLERQLFRVDIQNGQLEQLTQTPGFHFAALSGDGKYLVEQFSNVETPPVISILNSDGSPQDILGKSAGPALDLPKLRREFLTVKTHDGVDLYTQLVKPENFDPKRKYGIVVHWYGGPGLQMVSNRYGTTNIFNIIERDVLYTQAGFIVWRLDNRGSFGRGHGFERSIAGQLGPAALDDQLAGIEYLKTLPYVDGTRICSDGKSFGGFLTLYALIFAPDVIHCGVAGSGPTDWSYYDTIYTERYMRTPEQNPTGYAATNLVERADQIQAKPLIIHGLADTNVHLQNSINFIQALMAADKPFDFLPLPNEDHHYEGDGLANCLQRSVDYFIEQISE